MFAIRRFQRSGTQITENLWNLDNGVLLQTGVKISPVEQSVFEALKQVGNVGRLLAFVEDENTEIRRRKYGWLIGFGQNTQSIAPVIEPQSDVAIRDLWDQIIGLIQQIHKAGIALNNFQVEKLFRNKKTKELLLINLANSSQQVPIDIVDEIYHIVDKLKRLESYSERRIFLSGSKASLLMKKIKEIKQKKPKIDEIDKLNKLIRKIWKNV